MSAAELSRAAVALEMAAGALNSVAARVGHGTATADEFANAVDAHEMAREEYRNWLSIATGQPSSHTERLLSL